MNACLSKGGINMYTSRLRLGTLRIVHKIMAISGAGVIGLLLVGGIYVSGTWSQATCEKITAAASAVAASVEQLSIKMLEARRTEKDFLLRNDEKYVKAHAELVRRIAEIFDDTARQLSASGRSELLQQLHAARADYDRYVKQFAAVADSVRKIGLNENDGLQGTLRKAVHDIEATTTELKEVRLEAAMLTMRRHEKDFMLRRDASYGEKMKKAAAEFSRVLADAQIPAARKDDMAQKLGIYQRDFFAYMAGVQAAAQNQKAMSDAYAKFEPQVASLVQTI